ncbi:UDP-glucuronosyl/UDP-glucosyltransferase [Macleaya cordata]|uniref:UDP-glucuronosyl/UDP-glucosyltransferase n=1 Tax=Macleaya cordata TaxID=56857 RepID=A0A200QG10_MACCD|nr:UDP-glucuronosyl/UDP-glucosyltransferase [Macleaya cordata]
MSDIPFSMVHLLITAFHRLQNKIQSMLINLNPNFVFYDFTYWIPSFTHPIGIKSIGHSIVSAASFAYFIVPSRNIKNDDIETKMKLMNPPPNFPPYSPLKLHFHEVHSIVAFMTRKIGDTNLFFFELSNISMKECDLVAIRTCREIEGPYCDYLEVQYGKPVLLTGPALPDQQNIAIHPLEEKWANWLGGFKPGSVLYCAFGSEWVLRKDQFQELVLGFELTGMPFLVALKPPVGAATVEEVLPTEFEERVSGRGVVYGGWVQ